MREREYVVGNIDGKSEGEIQDQTTVSLKFV